jgi:hypothetical protein
MREFSPEEKRKIRIQEIESTVSYKKIKKHIPNLREQK